MRIDHMRIVRNASKKYLNGFIFDPRHKITFARHLEPLQYFKMKKTIEDERSVFYGIVIA